MKEKLGDRVRELRREKGLTQRDLAKMTGITSIGKIEVNEGTVSLKNLEKLANFFNCSTDYLLGRVDE